MLHNWLALEILSLTGLMILGKNCVLAPKLKNINKLFLLKILNWIDWEDGMRG